MTTKRMLAGATLLVLGLLPGTLTAQEPGSISGNVTLQSSHEGVPEVAITLCQDSGRQTITEDLAVQRLPPRGQLAELRITDPNGPQRQVMSLNVSPECTNPRRTTTDNSGRFGFSAVAPGPYKVHAQRSGYIGESLRGTPPAVVTQSVTVLAGRAVPDVSFSVMKGGAISGTVRDPNGNALPSADVQILFAKGGPQGLVASRQTDDRGQYRLFGLPPGEYIVVVRWGTITTINAMPDGKTALSISNAAEPGTALRYVPTYHPNSLSSADARTIVLGEGEEVSGIDVVLRPQP